MDAPGLLRVVAAAVVVDRRLLLVSKVAAPDVFYLPGGKPEPGEPALETLAREVEEELGVGLRGSEELGVVVDEAALERLPMEMQVYLAELDGDPAPRAEIAALAWAASVDEIPGRLAPAVRNHVVPLLAARGLIG